MPDELGQSDPNYRLTQFKEAELCSCGSNRRYGECCRRMT
ncbi:SEC-C metal-binding domain-containing protein [Mesorhizobium ciceri]